MQKYFHRKHFSDMMKIGTFFAASLFFLGLNLYYINLSSTRGYFLRQANQSLSTADFEHEIIRSELLKLKQTNRENMRWSSSSRSVVNVRAEIVSIPVESDSVARN